MLLPPELVELASGRVHCVSAGLICPCTRRVSKGQSRLRVSSICGPLSLSHRESDRTCDGAQLFPSAAQTPAQRDQISISDVVRSPIAGIAYSYSSPRISAARRALFPATPRPPAGRGRRACRVARNTCRAVPGAGRGPSGSMDEGFELPGKESVRKKAVMSSSQRAAKSVFPAKNE